jgi:hypothetical protein
MIDTSYFIQDISIPNLDKVTNSITTAISRYEKEILINLLGYELYNEFVTELAGSPAQKWLDLRDGADFELEFNGRTYSLHWNGLVNDDKVSLISYYVYYKYRENNITVTTGVGEARGKAENSVIVDDIPKMVNAWNSMVDLYGYIPKVYHYTWTMDYLRAYTPIASAYNFLWANRVDYPTWVFEPIAYKNRFDL